MRSQHIRPLALCIFRKNNRILVFEGHDPATGAVFYRPLGGGIEFGEHSTAAAVREIREELRAEICNLSYFCTIENIFTHNGARGHEIIQLYHAEFADPTFYNRESLQGVEDDGTPIKVVWKNLESFRQDGTPLYPEGLLELLTESSEEE